jgi:hypothetical protein
LKKTHASQHAAIDLVRQGTVSAFGGEARRRGWRERELYSWDVSQPTAPDLLRDSDFSAACIGHAMRTGMR